MYTLYSQKIITYLLRCCYDLRMTDVQKLKNASSHLSREDVYVKDTRSNSSNGIPYVLFERVVRSVTDVLHKYKTHPEKDIQFIIEDASESVDNASVSIDVRLFTQTTPNTLEYLANNYEQVAAMGADSVSNDWITSRYRFYTPTTTNAFKSNDDGSYPPIS